MNEKKRILVVGPSPTRSKGGMATVIEEIEKDKKLNEQFDIDIYESFIDGNKLVRIFFSIYAFIKFCLTKRNYDLYHVHVASRGSTFRKGHYVDAMSILEGMACGKAIVSTTVGAIPEVINRENGILIQPGDVKALANALVECSINTALIEQMSKNNIKKIDGSFSMKTMHKKLARYYETV